MTARALLTDGRSLVLVAAVETAHGLRFVDTLGNRHRPETVVSYQPVAAPPALLATHLTRK